MSIELLTTLTVYNNPHYLSRYMSFIRTRLGGPRIKYQTHYHHILPKAVDFFPEFTSLKDFPWNGVHLTAREHFIAHRLLHLAFPGSSQTLAFYNMANICGKTNSRAYADARKVHIAITIPAITSCPKRNAKISAALKGKPKSAEHIAKLVGHVVSEETREKLRSHNLGRKASPEARSKMSATRTGLKKRPLSDQGKQNISAAKKQAGRKWFNNGTLSKLMSGPVSTEWVPGRLPWK